MGKTKAVSAPVSDLKSYIGFWLRFVSNHVSQAFARKLLNSGATVAEWVVMREMFGEEELTSAVVAERTGLTRGAVSKLVERLEAKKLLSRRERDDDRRYQDIALTAAGKRLVPTLAALADRNDEEFFAALSEVERSELIRTMKKLVAANGLRRVPTE